MSQVIHGQKQLCVASYSGSRQGTLQLLQTSETKTFIKRSFGGNKKLYSSKEVKEFPTKLLKRSNSVIDKNHSTSMLECTGNICAVKTKNPPQHTPPIFLRYPVTLFHGQIIPSQIISSQIILLLNFFVSSSTI